jgi:hypothetical protein
LIPALLALLVAGLPGRPPVESGAADPSRLTLERIFASREFSDRKSVV